MVSVLPISPYDRIALRPDRFTTKLLYDQITLQVNRPTRLACHTKIIETSLPKPALMFIELIRIYHL